MNSKTVKKRRSTS